MPATEPAYKYELHLPAGFDPNRKYPAIFTLHGKGSNERNMYSLVSPLSESFIMIGIRGNLPLGSGFQYYELKSLGHPIRELFDEAVRQLDAFIDYATDKYPIDPQRRYLLGFSQGAILSASLALTMGSRLKGIVALNGYIPGFVKTEYPLQSVRDVSVFISHGEYDPVFPLEIGRETAAYFQNRTPHLAFKTYPTGHEVSLDNQRDFVNWLKADTGLEE
ncbi:alpha/beta hydrolase [Paenibacillus caui]|uniref:alpha/beta hydrolase n=1 Tax=Paenibacillus caui TaxID=2873927 RepID=UPI001CA8F289|nr:dienelactone hydrolase family protein [Paenibacillus caui]